MYLPSLLGQGIEFLMKHWNGL